MATYASTAFVTAEDSVTVVIAALATKLNTLDSTTNAIVEIRIKPLSNGKVIGTLIYK